MSYRVKYETEDGATVATPEDYHTENEPLLTMLWYADTGGVERSLAVPVDHVIHVEHKTE